MCERDLQYFSGARRARFNKTFIIIMFTFETFAKSQSPVITRRLITTSRLIFRRVNQSGGHDTITGEILLFSTENTQTHSDKPQDGNRNTER